MILNPDPNLEVKFELYDKDIDSDDFLGRLVESLSELHGHITKCTHIPQIHSYFKPDTYMYIVVLLQ